MATIYFCNSLTVTPPPPKKKNRSRYVLMLIRYNKLASKCSSPLLKYPILPRIHIRLYTTFEVRNDIAPQCFFYFL